MLPFLPELWMNPLRIAASCAFGPNSSQVLKRRIEAVLRKHHLTAEVFVADRILDDDEYDLVITSQELAGAYMMKDKPVVVISNFFATKEIERKGIPVIVEIAKQNKPQRKPHAPISP